MNELILFFFLKKTKTKERKNRIYYPGNNANAYTIFGIKIVNNQPITKIAPIIFDNCGIVAKKFAMNAPKKKKIIIKIN